MKVGHVFVASPNYSCVHLVKRLKNGIVDWCTTQFLLWCTGSFDFIQMCVWCKLLPSERSLCLFLCRLEQKKAEMMSNVHCSPGWVWVDRSFTFFASDCQL